MLDQKVIIYDDSCPMCRLYTYWFVAWGFLRPENRIGFATAPDEITRYVDLNRGRHEIPLFDRKSKSTLYGLGALTHILASKWKWLEPLFKSKLFWVVFYPIYQIITYNRRVIAGCKHHCGFDCAPDFNMFYRTLYLGLASLLIVGITIVLMLLPGEPARVGVALIGGFAFVGLLCASIRNSFNSMGRWDDLGNLVTTIVMVSLVLLALAVFRTGPSVQHWLIVVVAGLVGLEEVDRRSL